MPSDIPSESTAANGSGGIVYPEPVLPSSDDDEVRVSRAARGLKQLAATFNRNMPRVARPKAGTLADRENSGPSEGEDEDTVPYTKRVFKPKRICHEVLFAGDRLHGDDKAGEVDPTSAAPVGVPAAAPVTRVVEIFRDGQLISRTTEVFGGGEAVSAPVQTAGPSPKTGGMQRKRKAVDDKPKAPVVTYIVDGQERTHKLRIKGPVDPIERVAIANLLSLGN